MVGFRHSPVQAAAVESVIRTVRGVYGQFASPMETSGDTEGFTASGVKALTVTAKDNDRAPIDDQAGESGQRRAFLEELLMAAFAACVMRDMHIRVSATMCSCVGFSRSSLRLRPTKLRTEYGIGRKMGRRPLLYASQSAS